MDTTKTYIIYDGLEELFELDAPTVADAYEQAEKKIQLEYPKVVTFVVADKDTGYLVFP